MNIKRVPVAHLFIVVQVYCYLVFLNPLHAQQEQFLPAASVGQARVLQGQQDEQAFREFLLAPIADWLRSGQIALPAVQDLAFAWEYPQSWRDASSTNAIYLEVDAQNGIRPRADFSPSPGLPFGFADAIAEVQTKDKAQRILWNLEFANRTFREQLYGIELSWVSEQTRLRSSRGIVFRGSAELGSYLANSTREEEELQPVQYGILRLFSPPVVLGYTQISWRYAHTKEDRVWLFSPVVGRVREVPDSNRSDGILGSSLAMDDLFVWSANPRMFNAEIVSNKRLLVPFVSLQIAGLEIVNATPIPQVEGAAVGSANILSERLMAVEMPHARTNSEAVAGLWNFETQRFPAAFAWAPSSLVFVPRDVWILELRPKDPFYDSGKIILVVDRNTMLPVYKVVHNLDGSFKRIVMGAWGMAASEDRKLVLPYLGLLLAKDNNPTPAIVSTTLFVHPLEGQGKTKSELDKLRNLEFPSAE